MDFPLMDLVDHDRSRIRLREHFHPEGLQCPRCGASWREAYRFRRTKSSRLQVWRCKDCAQTYTRYSGTVFEGHHLPPARVVLLLRGIVQGKSTAQMARELDLSRTIVHEIRKQLQANTAVLQPEACLPDYRTETDEMFQNAGKKGEPRRAPTDPPHRRANKARGGRTYENDRTPVVGTVGRTSGQVRLWVLCRTDGERLCPHVHRCTFSHPMVYTDEWKGYNMNHI